MIHVWDHRKVDGLTPKKKGHSSIHPSLPHPSVPFLAYLGRFRLLRLSLSSAVEACGTLGAMAVDLPGIKTRDKERARPNLH